MEWLHFLAAVELDLSTYFIALGVTAFIYIFAYRPYIRNVFDPLFMVVAQFIFAASVVAFLYIDNTIADDALFYSFLTIEASFFMGFALSYGKRNSIACVVSIINRFPVFDLPKLNIYYFYGILFVLEKLITYASFGLPIFSQGTHAAFYQGYGKILQGIELAILPVILFLLLERYLSPSIQRELLGKIYDIGLTLFILFALLTTGAKSSLFIVMFSLFFYILYVKKTYCAADADVVLRRVKLWYIGIFSLVIGGAFFTLFLEEASDAETIGLILTTRLVASGDVFAYFFQSPPGQYVGLGNGIIGILLELFGSIFDKLGLMAGANHSVIEELYWQFLHIFPGSGQGPNIRYDLFGLIFFDYVGAVIYAFCLGTLSGVARSIVMERANVNAFVFVLSTQLYYYSLLFTIDLVLSFNYLWKVWLFNLILFFISWWMFRKRM